MIDHILQFASEAEAFTILGPLGYASRDGAGPWSWDTSRVVPAQAIISAEAVWNRSDPQNPVLTTPEVRVSGFWVMVSLPNRSAPLIGSGKIRQIRDREKGIMRQSYITNDTGVIQTARISPVFAGSDYV